MTLLNPETPGLRCSRCGGPMPKLRLDDDDRRLLTLPSRAIELLCPTCSGSAAPAAEPAGRHFELEVYLTEVKPPAEGEALGSRERLMDWRVPATAPSLGEALRPLVDGFAARWERAEQAAHIADADPEVPS